MYVPHDSQLPAFFCDLFSGTQQQGPTNLMNRIDDEITLQRASTMAITQAVFAFSDECCPQSRFQSGATEALSFGVESAK